MSEVNLNDKTNSISLQNKNIGTLNSTNKNNLCSKESNSSNSKSKENCLDSNKVNDMLKSDKTTTSFNLLNMFNYFFKTIQEMVLPNNYNKYEIFNLDENSMNTIFKDIFSEINKLKEKIPSEEKKYIDASTNTEFDFINLSDFKQTIENNQKNFLKKIEEQNKKFLDQIKEQNITFNSGVMKTIYNGRNITPLNEKKIKKKEYNKDNSSKIRTGSKSENRKKNNNINLPKITSYTNVKRNKTKKKLFLKNIQKNPYLGTEFFIKVKNLSPNIK